MRGHTWCAVTVLLLLGSLHPTARCHSDESKEEDEEAVEEDLYEDDSPLEDVDGEKDEPFDEEEEGDLDNFDDLSDNEEEDTERKPQEDRLYKGLVAALKRPGMERRMGEVMTIIRAMSPPQRLALAALLTAQALRSSGAGTKESLETVQQMFGIHEGDDEEKRRNITSSLLLPISWDIANMFRGAAASGRSLRNDVVEAQGLRYFRDGYPQRRGNKRPSRFRTSSYRPPGVNRRNSQVPKTLTNLHPPPPPPASTSPATTSRRPTGSSTPKVPEEEEPALCTPFANNLCLEVDEYPIEAILASLKRNQGAMEALLLDNQRAPEEEYGTEMEIQRRQDPGNDVDTSDGGYMCPSTVKYARPKRARATSGHWKYIVNTGDYTQTLRLDMCTRPQKSCAFISDNFRSECTQVYNYHRLLSWDNAKGLHMDIFKVPTCCSCYVKGYSQFFPPIDPIPDGHQDRFPGEIFHHEAGVDGGGVRPTNYHNNNAYPVPQGTNYRQEIRNNNNNNNNNIRQENYFHQDIRNGFQTNRGQGFGQSAEDFELQRNPSVPYGVRFPPPATPQYHPQSLPPPMREQPRDPYAVYPDYQIPRNPPHGEYVHNQIRRSRNQTALRPGDLEFGASDSIVVHSTSSSPKPMIVSKPEVIRRTTSSTSMVVGGGPPMPIATKNVNKANNNFTRTPNSTSPDKINYNYHPIIDFFRSQQENGRVKERAANNDRATNNMADWTPIVVQPEDTRRSV